MGRDALNKIMKAATPPKDSPPLLARYSYLSPRDEKRFENLTSYACVNKAPARKKK